MGRSARWKFTPEMDATIAAVYRTHTGKGEVKALSARWNIPRWKISRRALYLGVVEPRSKEPDWSDAELQILERYAHLTPAVLQRRLQRKGFHRSPVAIVLKRKRMRYPQNLAGMSANQLKDCFGVDATTITRWIRTGLLHAERRGTERTAAQGGDQYFINERDVRDFVLGNLQVVDIRKVDKFWLVDLLVNGPGNKRQKEKEAA